MPGPEQLVDGRSEPAHPAERGAGAGAAIAQLVDTGARAAATRVRVAFALGVLGLIGLGGCSGAEQGGDTTPPAPAAEPAASAGAHGGSDPDDERRRAALAALRERQEAACRDTAGPVFQCAVEDARRSLSPEQFAELEVDKLEPEHRRRYLQACLASEMSLRQVEVYERCLADTACEVFLPCIEDALPTLSE